MIRKIFLLACLVSAVACSKKGSGGSDAPSVTTYAVKGDPHLLLKGSQPQPQSLFTLANIQDLNNYSLTAVASFVERSSESASSASTTQSNLEDENSANDGSTPTSYRLQMSQIDATSYKATVEGLGLDMLFAQDASSKMQIKSLTSGGETVSVNVLHWSQTTDGAYVSVLLDYVDDSTGQNLVALYFHKDETQAVIPQLGTQYFYLGGPGKGINWDTQKGLKFEVCGDTSTLQQTQASMSQWQAALFGRLNIQVAQATTYAPFSDLNQHCLYMVDTYVSDPRTDVANFGITIPVLDRAQGKILDADILIFKAEFDKLRAPATAAGYSEAQYQQLIRFYKSYTFTHELGHVLGLDHQFTGVSSIMSYDFAVSTLTSYDFHAIQTLYPTPVSP